MHFCHAHQLLLLGGSEVQVWLLLLEAAFCIYEILPMSEIFLINLYKIFSPC